MVATLPPSLATNHELSGFEVTELLSAIAATANYKLFMSIGGCTLSTTSATDVPVVNATWLHTKLGNGSESDILVVIGISAMVSVQPNFINYSVSNGSVTQAAAFMYYNVAAHRDMTWGLARFGGQASSTYQYQINANVSGGATATMTASDTVFALTLEIPN